MQQNHVNGGTMQKGTERRPTVIRWYLLVINIGSADILSFIHILPSTGSLWINTHSINQETGRWFCLQIILATVHFDDLFVAFSGRRRRWRRISNDELNTTMFIDRIFFGLRRCLESLSIIFYSLPLFPFSIFLLPSIKDKYFTQ